MSVPDRSRLPAGPAGFTLIELMIVVTIIAALASIALPVYESAVGTARVQKAKQELRTISTEVDVFRAQNNGVLPLTLADVGHGGRRDPWGNPYCYLNFKAATGDGLEWAVEQGLVDPGMLGRSGDTPVSTGQRDQFRAEVLGMTYVGAPVMSVVDTNSVKRRDRFLFPLNSDYDLFSLGSNRSTNVSVGEGSSLDDIIRANDGGFFGLAAEY